MKRFPIAPDEARAIVASCRIIHPYGDLGSLAAADFGQDLRPEESGTGDQLIEMSERLLTFTQSKSVKTDDIHGILAGAARIVFLGFGFHRQNVELLTTPDARIVDFRATAHELAKNARRHVISSVHGIMGRRPPKLNPDQLDQDHLVDCECGKLIRDEHLFLSS